MGETSFVVSAHSVRCVLNMVNALNDLLGVVANVVPSVVLSAAPNVLIAVLSVALMSHGVMNVLNILNALNGRSIPSVPTVLCEFNVLTVVLTLLNALND